MSDRVDELLERARRLEINTWSNRTKDDLPGLFEGTNGSLAYGGRVDDSFEYWNEITLLDQNDDFWSIVVEISYEGGGKVRRIPEFGFVFYKDGRTILREWRK